jgi:hypothetical protein
MQVAVGEIHLIWPVEAKAAALFGNPQMGSMYIPGYYDVKCRVVKTKFPL